MAGVSSGSAAVAPSSDHGCSAAGPCHYRRTRSTGRRLAPAAASADHSSARACTFGSRPVAPERLQRARRPRVSAPAPRSSPLAARACGWWRGRTAGDVPGAAAAAAWAADSANGHTRRAQYRPGSPACRAPSRRTSARHHGVVDIPFDPDAGRPRAGLTAHRQSRRRSGARRGPRPPPPQSEHNRRHARAPHSGSRTEHRSTGEGTHQS